jgi:hypothetical protein
MQMKLAYREIYKISPALMGVALIVLTILNLTNKCRIDHLKADNAMLSQKLEQAGGELATKTPRAQPGGPVTANPPASPIELFSWDIRTMQKKGLKDPVNDIVTDLKQNGRLIPCQPSMGGKMNFYDAGKIWILTGKWVFAYFEDGHNGGYILLEYEIEPGGKIIWKVLASYLA